MGGGVGSTKMLFGPMIQPGGGCSVGMNVCDVGLQSPPGQDGQDWSLFIALKIALYIMYFRTRVVIGTSSEAAMIFILSFVQLQRSAASQFFAQLLPLAIAG